MDIARSHQQVFLAVLILASIGTIRPGIAEIPDGFIPLFNGTSLAK